MSIENKKNQLKISLRGKGFSYITYAPGLEEKATIEAELKIEVCDKIELTNQYIQIGLLSSSSRNDVLNCVTKHFASLPSRYCLDNKADDVISHMKLLNKPINPNEAAVSCQLGNNNSNNTNNNIVLITVVCFDRPKIYNRITYALDKYVHSTLDADIMTTNTGKVELFFIPTTIIILYYYYL